MSGRSLAFVTSALAYRDERQKIWVNTGVGRLIEETQRRTGRLVVGLSQTRVREDQHDHVLDVPASRVTFLPAMDGIAAGMRMSGAVRAALARIERTVDGSIVQLPFSAPFSLLGGRVPRVYHLVGDIVTAVDASTRYVGMRRIAARTAARVIDRVQRNLVRATDASCVTNGAELHRLLDGRGRAVVSSTLLSHEVASVPRVRAPTAPFRLLFVGYLRPEKGIDLILEAFQALRRNGVNVELVVVGAVDTGLEVAARIGADIAALAQREPVFMRGAIPFGPALFQEYADADVLLAPSRSEGTPRVLVEARAFGCPVIGSRVGGIPSSIDDETDGLLVAPNDVAALIEAIERVRTDHALRARLVVAGTARARRTTVDAQAQALVDETETLLTTLHKRSSGRRRAA